MVPLSAFRRKRILRTEESTVESLAARYAEIGGFPFDDARVTALEDDIIDARVVAIKRYLDQSSSVPINLYERLSFVSDGTFQEDEEHTVEIPSVMEGKNGRLLLFVYSGTGRSRGDIAVILPIEAGFIQYRKFTSRDPYVVYTKGKLELINMQGIDFTVEAVFESIPYVNGKRTINPFLLDMMDTILLRKYGSIRPIETDAPSEGGRQQDS